MPLKYLYWIFYRLFRFHFIRSRKGSRGNSPVEMRDIWLEMMEAYSLFPDWGRAPSLHVPVSRLPAALYCAVTWPTVLKRDPQHCQCVLLTGTQGPHIPFFGSHPHFPPHALYKLACWGDSRCATLAQPIHHCGPRRPSHGGQPQTHGIWIFGLQLWNDHLKKKNETYRLHSQPTLFSKLEDWIFFIKLSLLFIHSRGPLAKAPETSSRWLYVGLV